MPHEEKNINIFIDRLPPQDLNAEVAVLGSMMQDILAVTRAIEILGVGDDGALCFYKSEHQKIYKAISVIFDKSNPVDVLTVGKELNRTNDLDAIGGNYYLTELIARVPSAANIAFHANTVLEKAKLRLAVGIGVEITEDAFNVQASSDEVIDRAEQKLFKLSTRSLRNGFVPINPVLAESFEIIDKNHQKPGSVVGVPTGFTELDDMLGGLQRSDLIIVAGRPSMGKTAFALNITRNAAIDHKVGVGFFSLEMARWQLGIRLICSEARVNSHLARSGKLSARDMASLAQAVSKINEAPIFIDDSPALTAMEIRAKARRLASEKNVGLFIVDYLQNMRHPESENRNVAIGHSTQALKALAKELNVPVVVLSQLSRKVEGRDDGRPILSDLRESGAIEQDADVVLFPFAPNGAGIIIIGKQRNGPTDDVPIMFLKDYVMFANLAKGRENAGSANNNRYEHVPARDREPDLPF